MICVSVCVHVWLLKRGQTGPSTGGGGPGGRGENGGKVLFLGKKWQKIGHVTTINFSNNAAFHIPGQGAVNTERHCTYSFLEKWNNISTVTSACLFALTTCINYILKSILKSLNTWMTAVAARLWTPPRPDRRPLPAAPWLYPPVWARTT